MATKEQVLAKIAELKKVKSALVGETTSITQDNLDKAGVLYVQKKISSLSDFTEDGEEPRKPEDIKADIEKTQKKLDKLNAEMAKAKGEDGELPSEVDALIAEPSNTLKTVLSKFKSHKIDEKFVKAASEVAPAGAENSGGEGDDNV